jgi:hypothetical protein
MKPADKGSIKKIVGVQGELIVGEEVSAIVSVVTSSVFFE